jgi:hypothetical protein
VFTVQVISTSVTEPSHEMVSIGAAVLRSYGENYQRFKLPEQAQRAAIAVQVRTYF